MLKEYARFAADKTFELLAIDSPTGFTQATDMSEAILRELKIPSRC